MLPLEQLGGLGLLRRNGWCQNLFDATDLSASLILMEDSVFQAWDSPEFVCLERLVSGCDVNACRLITFKPGLQEILLLLKYILLIVYAISCQGKIWGTIWLFWSRQLLVIAGFTLVVFFFFLLELL